MPCEYCRATNLKTFINDKVNIPTNYCPVCGEKRKGLYINTNGTDAINYISEKEMLSKLYSEKNQNLPHAIPTVCQAAKIPEEYWPAVEELIATELDSVIDMVKKGQDIFTVLKPEDKWNSTAEALVYFKKHAKSNKFIEEIKSKLEDLRQEL